MSKTHRPPSVDAFFIHGYFPIAPQPFHGASALRSISPPSIACSNVPISIGASVRIEWSCLLPHKRPKRGRSESRQASCDTCRLMVPLTRLELVQHCCRGILSPLCLPIPPQRQETVCLYHRLFPPPCQDDKRVIFKKMKKAPHCGGKPQPGRINRRRRRTLRVKVRGGCRILRRLQDLLKKRIAFLHAVWYHRVHVFYDKKEE